MTGAHTRDLGFIITDRAKTVLEALATGPMWGPDLKEKTGHGSNSSANVGHCCNHGWVARCAPPASQFQRYGITEMGIHVLTFARLERGEFMDLDTSREIFHREAKGFTHE